MPYSHVSNRQSLPGHPAPFNPTTTWFCHMYANQKQDLFVLVSTSNSVSLPFFSPFLLSWSSGFGVVDPSSPSFFTRSAGSICVLSRASISARSFRFLGEKVPKIGHEISHLRKYEYIILKTHFFFFQTNTANIIISNIYCGAKNYEGETDLQTRTELRNVEKQENGHNQA